MEQVKDDSSSREALYRLMHPNCRRMTDEEYRNSPKRWELEQA